MSNFVDSFQALTSTGLFFYSFYFYRYLDHRELFSLGCRDRVFYFYTSRFLPDLQKLREYGHAILVAHSREARGGSHCASNWGCRSHRGHFRGSSDCSKALHRRSCPPVSQHCHCRLYCLRYISSELLKHPRSFFHLQFTEIRFTR